MNVTAQTPMFTNYEHRTNNNNNGHQCNHMGSGPRLIGWQLKVSVLEFDASEHLLTVTGDTHVGGVIFQLVEQLGHIKNDWSTFALWWPAKKQWLNKTKMTLDQYGVQGDALLEFTCTHKPLRVELPDHQVLELNVDFSSSLFHSIKNICKELGIRYAEELSLLRSNPTPQQTTAVLKSPISKATIATTPTHEEDHSVSSSSNTSSTLNNSQLSNPSFSMIRFPCRLSQSWDPQSLSLSPYVPVHAYLASKDTHKYKNHLDKSHVNARWLDSSLSIMEQAVSEGDLVHLRFKYFAFNELNPSLDSVRINQIYEQAKWSMLTEEIDSTEQELIHFAALQLQCNMQTKRMLSNPSLDFDSSTTTNKRSSHGNGNFMSSPDSSGAIYEDDDVDTALSKLEKSLDTVHVTSDNQRKTPPKDSTKQSLDQGGQFKLELAEELFLLRQQKMTFKKLKAFFFVLDSACYLSYFKNQAESVNGRPIDKICLKGCELVPDVNVSHRKFGINLKVPSSEGMTEMCLRCGNEASYARWLSACKLASCNRTISKQAFNNEASSILSLLQVQQNSGPFDAVDSGNNKFITLQPNAGLNSGPNNKSTTIDSRMVGVGAADSADNTQASNLLPLRILKKHKVKALNDKILEAYSAISHLDLHEAKWNYIQAWQALPSYGISYFTVKLRGSRQKQEVLGIASNRLLRISAEGETVKTWRFNALKSWNVNWETKQIEILFEDEELVFTCLTADPRILHEFIGGYIYLSLRNAEKSAQVDEAMFMKLTEKR